MKSSIQTCTLVIGLLPFLALGACAQPAPESTPVPASSTPARVSLPDTEVRQLKSSETGRNYDIYIRLPAEYTQTKKYPVLYLLDGHWDFKLLDSIYGGLYYDGFVPEMIIVGITYSGDNPDYNSLRAMDYTPFHESFVPGSGDAPKFLAFLKKELFPLIESSYRVDTSRRVLMGHSFGGTFTLYAMFAEPELFSGYVAGSPPVPLGGQFAFEQEAKYASSHKDLPVRLYLFVGGSEDLTYPVERFMQVLLEREYPSLEMETLTIAEEGHASNKPEGFNRGLRYIFRGE
ncbi:MAG: alpha/beta hydrolase [Anaerolineales bacterium]|nr:alpha/beta hydrolase [Anaerolineales bacterium]